ncbi:MAG: hypothetical protein LUC27_02500, partial [Lachnospiraceae bacterium]|nr:hypothetical protein [Lachnospiraceae bacterium]
MKNNSILKSDNQIVRVLAVKDNQIFVIDCCKRNMPQWANTQDYTSWEEITESELLEYTSVLLPDIDTMDAKGIKTINERFTMISDVLPVLTDSTKRNRAITKISVQMNLSKQTIRNYLCLYLVYQNKAILAPKPSMSDSTLTADEKNMRWALNKFFYTRNQNSLKTAYTLMIKERYCDGCGQLLPVYPTYNQFRYFYRKHKKMQTYYISRDGIKSYERNNR